MIDLYTANQNWPQISSKTEISTAIYNRIKLAQTYQPYDSEYMLQQQTETNSKQPKNVPTLYEADENGAESKEG